MFNLHVLKIFYRIIIMLLSIIYSKHSVLAVQPTHNNDGIHVQPINGTYKIMVVLPSRESALNLYGLTIDKVKPIIDVAVQDLYQKRYLPRNYLMFNYFDSKYHINSFIAERRVTVKVFEEYFSGHNLNALLGFADSYTLATVAKVSAGLPNPIPVVTTVGRVSALGQKVEYPYLTRMLGNWDQLSAGVYNFLHPKKVVSKNLTYNIGFFFKDKKRSKYAAKPMPAYTISSDCYFAMHSIKQYFIEKNLQYRKKWRNYIPTSIFDEDTLNATILHRLLKELTMSSNTLLLCGSQQTLKAIMEEANRIGLLHSGTNFTFINIDVGANPTEMASTNNSIMYDASVIADVVKKATTVTPTPLAVQSRSSDKRSIVNDTLKHLKTISFRRTYSHSYYQIVGRATAIAELEYSYSQRYGKPYAVNDFIMSFYDAVMLYALAVNRTLSVGNTNFTIKQLSADIWSQTFNGTFGEVRFNDNGDRIMDVCYIVNNPKTNNYETVAIYSEISTSSTKATKSAQNRSRDDVAVATTLRILNAKLYSDSLPAVAEVFNSNNTNHVQQKCTDIFAICKYLVIATMMLAIIALLMFISAVHNSCIKMEIQVIKSLFTSNDYFNADNDNSDDNHGNNNDENEVKSYWNEVRVVVNPLLENCTGKNGNE